MSANQFSLILSKLMKSEKLSKRALAKNAGLQRKSILEWLKGAYYPRYNALIKLANYFNVSTDYLLGREQYSGKHDIKSICDINDVPKRFVDILNNYINENDISKYKLAQDLKIGESTLNRWFDKGSMPETEVLMRIADLLDESVDYLLSRE